MNYKTGCIFFLILFLLTPVYAYADKKTDAEITVNNGDRLINICNKYLANPRKCKQVIKENRLENPNLIYRGQKIKIPVNLLKGMPTDGFVTFIKGDVMVKQKEGPEWAELKINDAVREGSGIKTGRESSVEIVFEDTASLFLKADTTGNLSIARKGDPHFIREFFLGAGRAVTNFRNATGQKQRFNIRTPSAVASARGTEFRTSVDTNGSTRSEVLKGRIEVEAMMKKVEVEEGEGTVVRMGKPPLAPRELLSPPPPVEMESNYRALPIRLAFAGVEGASSYRIILSRDSKMKDVLKESVIGKDALFEVAEIDDGAYYLQSSSIDSNGIEGLPLDPVKINVSIHPVSPFINSPTDGSEYRHKTMKCSWLKVVDAASYHLQIAEDKDFKVVVADAKLKETEYTARLEYKTYFFRLRSIAADEYEGMWSDVQRFVVLSTPPSTPLDQQPLEKNEITIRWHDLGPGFSYHFQMAADHRFNEIVVDKNVKTPFIILQKPDKPGTYYVRTSSVGANGYEGSFSQPQSFEVKRRFPVGIAGIVGAVGIILLLAP
jgi:hypothetical protein